MKKRSILLIFFAVITFAFAACGGGADAGSDAWTLVDIQDDPSAFEGEEITLVGRVMHDGQHSFTLISDDSFLVLPIDYRGAEALPQNGAEIIIVGAIGAICCPGDPPIFQSIQFEVVG